jgi:aminocarboxymuconate-semialdehyde decarboxylase
MVAIARLVCSGHLTRYKNTRIVVPMGAAGLPFLIGRLKQNHKVTPKVADPVEALSHLYYDSILHDARVLRFVIEILGADRLMMGSDMPFPIGDDEPAKIVQEAGLTAAQVAAINGGLAQKLFRIA